MQEHGYSGQQRSGFTLTLILAAHAAALVALAFVKIQVTPEPPATPIETWNVPIKPPPPPEVPLPDPKIEPRLPRSQSDLTTIKPLVPTRSDGPVVVPAPADDVVFNPFPVGDKTVLPTPAPAPMPRLPEPAVEKPAPVRLKPRGNPASWVTNEDYPSSALRTEEQGRTAFSLAVGADGRPVACTVTASSGSSTLDGAACRLLMRRARFVPGIDAEGRPAGGTYTNSFSWRIPED